MSIGRIMSKIGLLIFLAWSQASLATVPPFEVSVKRGELSGKKSLAIETDFLQNVFSNNFRSGDKSKWMVTIEKRVASNAHLVIGVEYLSTVDSKVSKNQEEQLDLYPEVGRHNYRHFLGRIGARFYSGDSQGLDAYKDSILPGVYNGVSVGIVGVENRFLMASDLEWNTQHISIVPAIDSGLRWHLADTLTQSIGMAWGRSIVQKTCWREC